MSIKKMLLQYPFPVSKIIKSVGESVEISWTAPFFPQAGKYNIYHTNDENKSIPIIEIDLKNRPPQKEKYTYLSQPLNSTNIMFMIRDITLDDAGYYAGGTSVKAALSGGGVVLIVLGESNLGLLLFICDLILSYHFALLPIIYIVSLWSHYLFNKHSLPDMFTVGFSSN